MTALDLVARLRRRLWWVVVGSLLGLAAAYAVWTALPRTYTSSTSLYITATDSRDAAALSQGASYVQTQIPSYPTIVTSPVVLQTVADRTGLGTPAVLAQRITAEVATGSSVLTISATGPNPREATALATAAASSFMSEIQTIETRPGTTTSPVRAAVVAPADDPTTPSAPKRTTLLATGLVLGLLLSAALALLVPRRKGAATATASTAPATTATATDTASPAPETQTYTETQTQTLPGTERRA